ncbi:anaerobic carbon-monoxide dehydrogenase catalytic subunit [Candidatus Electronema sp. JM]|uniref:anaerobic carbon-monoxide dehydrogenase catalytic subunit n=1 Tax=Candidatus Electronema sp. JM TaxID=3401571 RepID=UPI003AA96E8C
MNRSIDPAVTEILAHHKGGAQLQTAWDRYEAQLPQCGFGELGVCCRHCMQGPCRIDPFGEGAQRGICGADADTIVARGLARAVAGGTASHSGHARHLAHVLKKIAAGKAADYAITDEAKLKAVAARVGIATAGRASRDIARDLTDKALAEFSDKDEGLAWAATTVTKGRLEVFSRLGIVPTSIDSSVAEVMHRTTYGVDADPVNILLGALKCALADYAACHLAADLADILFGTPQPVVSRANLGVLKSGAVNIALHGHNPLLSDIIAQVASEPEMIEAAKQAGAAEGLNVVGICCTGNEVLMRHGIPLATSSVSQETAIMTGALDALVVDYQCIMPAVATAAECFHTKIITTMPIAKMPGAEHVEFCDERAADCARKILRKGIANFQQRNADKVCIPKHTSAAIAGFSAEAIIATLAKVNSEDPLKPLIDNIVAGNIRGICLFAGCNSVKVPQDRNYVEMVKLLLANNVLILATGCASSAYARHGFMTSEATKQYAGTGLAAVLTAVGEAAGLGGPLPPVLHMGSCVDNARPVDVAVAVADKLGVDLSQLPVVASAPEAVTEKAVAIGTWAVAAGLPVHLGIAPPVLGSKLVATVLTDKIKGLLGGYFLVEPDPAKAAAALLAVIDQRRVGLGL